MSEALILDQPAVEDVDAVTDALTEAFAAVKAAVLEERSVVLVLDDADLLGQGDPNDAAVACGLLGMMRTIAIEGAKTGWLVNAVSRRAEGEEAAREAAAWLASSGLSGQLIRVGTDHLGKVVP